jgi:UDP-4-amino-4,6-dideoxy-N-acetyl-beta-L-altrosamine N-acetyltransferase
VSAPQVRLRAVGLHDKDQLRAWRNQPSVARWMYTDHQIGEDEHARWFAAAMADPDRQYWIIEADGRPVGLINLYDIDRAGRQAGLAYYLADETVRGTGVGGMAGVQALEHAFGELGLGRVWAEALIENIASRGYLGSLGFREIEVRAGQAPRPGVSGEVARLALDAGDWPAARQAWFKRWSERGVGG